MPRRAFTWALCTTFVWCMISVLTSGIVAVMSGIWALVCLITAACIGIADADR